MLLNYFMDSHCRALTGEYDFGFAALGGEKAREGADGSEKGSAYRRAHRAFRR